MRNVALISLSVLAACNGLTGAGALEVGADDEMDLTVRPDAGDAGGADGAESNNQGASSSGIESGPLQPAKGVSVLAVTLYQAAGVDLVKDGELLQPKDTIIAGRDALLRVSLATDASHDGGDVVVRLRVGDQAIDARGVVSASSVADLSSTFNFKVPGAWLDAGAGFQIELLEDLGQGDPAPANLFPGAEPARLSLTDAPPLRLHIVPLRYTADGSNRLPDTGVAAIDELKRDVLAQYPVPAVDITIGEPVDFDIELGRVDQNAWSDGLDIVQNVRTDDAPEADVYYVGLANPDVDYASYCKGGCTAGLSFVGLPGDGASGEWRAAIALGFVGDAKADIGNVIAHEVGHTHGRTHTPCGNVVDADEDYPVEGGNIESWSYNAQRNAMMDPSKTFDFMSYCNPGFVSRYTYDALLDEKLFVQKAIEQASSQSVDASSLNQTYERVRVLADGTLQWLPDTQSFLPVRGKAVQAHIARGAISGTEDVVFRPYGHGGGVLLWKKGATAASSISVALPSGSTAVAR